MLAEEAPERVAVTVLGGGARLIGGARSAEFGREEVQTLLVDGFLPLVEPRDQPQNRRAAVVEFGLPYACLLYTSRCV